MISPVFDTLKAAKALQAAGFDDAQAEAVIATVGDAVGGNVATPADVQEVRTDIQESQADIREVRTDVQKLQVDVQELKVGIHALEVCFTQKFETLYKHLWAMSASIVIAIVALMTILP